ncbi:3-isopropylmalate dehydratase small subunit [Geobacillus sp. Y412MC52]|uniref:3-isopropylmalate dehydratase small subunit n=1 Tax=Geobacillus sp. (strain Y412MC52) TaxID=550542 RepID=UPI00018C1A84|nr:3-isopropylmalate dehydratase small subunit [Geobacillus sp. Y412MC52]ADU95956.1 3-isopropylmalate dehydratase, small subunit [Geobacillus sp. Y412MC52]
MKPFVRHKGLVAPLDRPNVDTDAILPKEFLKRVERTGFGRFLFHDWRFLENGNLNLDFILNQPIYRGASILLTRENFGCGSSREHAPWALLDYGFQVIIAPSFAEIFYNNSLKNGILLVTLGTEEVDELFQRCLTYEGYQLEVDLESCTIKDEYGLVLQFNIDPFHKETLIKGLDDIGRTLQHEIEIAKYEEKRPSYLNPKIS